MAKAEPRLFPFAEIAFLPRFAHGEECSVGAVCGANLGSELGTGFARMTGARIPWTITYDEVLTVIEGELTVHAGGRVHRLGPKDSMWLPAGTELVYEARDALVHYAVHPVTAIA
jgi:ethanolamine utilization protein EutQ